MQAVHMELVEHGSAQPAGAWQVLHLPHSSDAFAARVCPHALLEQGACCGHVPLSELKAAPGLSAQADRQLKLTC